MLQTLDSSCLTKDPIKKAFSQERKQRERAMPEGTKVPPVKAKKQKKKAKQKRKQRAEAPAKSGAIKRLAKRVGVLSLIAVIAGPSTYLYLQLRDSKAAVAETDAKLKSTSAQLILANDQNLAMSTKVQKLEDESSRMLAAAATDAKKLATQKELLESQRSELAAILKEDAAKKHVEIAIDNGNLRVSINNAALFNKEGEITPTGGKIAQAVGEFAKSKQNVKHLVLEGHTDTKEVANEQFGSSWELASHRAINVLYHLTDEVGISKKYVSVRSFAGTMPISTHAWKNRRIDFVLGYEK